MQSYYGHSMEYCQDVSNSTTVLGELMRHKVALCEAI